MVSYCTVLAPLFHVPCSRQWDTSDVTRSRSDICAAVGYERCPARLPVLVHHSLLIQRSIELIVKALRVCLLSALTEIRRRRTPRCRGQRRRRSCGRPFPHLIALTLLLCTFSFFLFYSTLGRFAACLAVSWCNLGIWRVAPRELLPGARWHHSPDLTPPGSRYDESHRAQFLLRAYSPLENTWPRSSSCAGLPSPLCFNLLPSVQSVGQ